MKRATVKMHLKLLDEALHLPEGCHVYNVLRMHEDYEDGTISLYLQGEGLPEVDPDKPTPQVQLVYEKVDGKIGLKAIELVK